MASRKLLRDLYLYKRPLSHQLLKSQQVSTSTTRLRLLTADGYSGSRQFSVFNEFSKQVKGEANSNEKFQQSVKELKEKTEELKVVKENMKERTKQTTEQLYKQVDGMWTEAEATAKKVFATFNEKFSAATEEIQETFGIVKQEHSVTSGPSANYGSKVKDGSKSASGEDKQQKSGPNDTEDTSFSKFKSNVSSISPKFSTAFRKLKETKPIRFAKKGYDILEDELSGNPSKRKRIVNAASSTAFSSKGERSTRTEVVILPSKQSQWSKKWEASKEKMQGHPIFKRVSELSKPFVTKFQEIVEDIKEISETSDHPVINKIQDVCSETPTAISTKEIRCRDPSFSLQEFVAQVRDVVKPVLTAYIKGDTEVLEKYCCPEVIERCKAEHKAYESQGIFLENKILHTSEVEVRETKMMGDTPIIIVAFQTQQVHCVRDRLGSITEGGKDTIQTVYNAWAIQQADVEELGENSLYPFWRLREMQQVGIQALI